MTITYAEPAGGLANTSRPDLHPVRSGDHLVARHLTDERRQHIVDDEVRPTL